MGRRSTVSCFKIIACGNSDPVDRDDLQAPEIKGSSDRRRWSFRNRSGTHRVLSNSVTSETPSDSKANPDSATVSFQMQPSSTAPEKASVVQCTEKKTQLSSPLELKWPETAAPAPDDGTGDITPDETIAIVIQAAIRGVLARRLLLKHKNIIKLQAAVRGHIVRRHAAGSLRCVQAIVKMQALVRERRARLLLEDSRTNKNEGKLDEKDAKENHGSTDSGKGNSGTKPHVTYTSIDKLLSNRFARQLMEPKRRTKTINIKCDPTKSDSSWKWLERWMSVSSVRDGQSLQFESMTEHQEEKKLEKLECQLENAISSPDNCNSRGVNSEVLAVPSEGDENVITYDMDSFESHACRLNLSLESHSSGNSSQNIAEAKARDNTLDFLPDHPRESDLVSKVEPDLFLDQSERRAPEEPENDGKKILWGLRKASNPAFIAAQSKFEQLTSSAHLTRSAGASTQHTGVDSSIDAVSLTREIGPAENSFPRTTGVEVGGSECGTELSISSTLDSPDRPDVVGVVNDEKESNNLDDGTNNSKSSLNLAVATEVESPVLERDSLYTDSVEQERHDNITNDECKNDGSVKLVDFDSSQIDQKPGTVETGVQMQLESEISCWVSKSSPEASPSSHVTVPESRETPSSQVSMKNKKGSGGKSGSNHKRRFESSGQGRPSDLSHNSGARNSSERLPKDHKTGKRRTSFGLTKTDHGDHDPRDSSSSSNSLPSYMQATESARAKALANCSPRSSPDVQEKDFCIKKRHSLPGTLGANTRQGPPRAQQSASHSQQGVKGNGIHSPRERKWRR